MLAHNRLCRTLSSRNCFSALLTHHLFLPPPHRSPSHDTLYFVQYVSRASAGPADFLL